MKKRNFLIIIAIVGILFINIIDANALQANNSGGGSGGASSGVSSSNYLNDSCLDNGTCMLVCSYSTDHKMNNNYGPRLITIYYNFKDDTWKVRWDGYQGATNPETGTIGYTPYSKGFNIYSYIFSDNGNYNIIIPKKHTANEFVCPNNAYLDFSAISSFDDLCFDNNGTSCTKERSKTGRDFEEASDKVYDFEDVIASTFDGYYNDQVGGLTCDNIYNNNNNVLQVVLDGVDPLLKNSFSISSSSSLPVFVTNTPTYKNKITDISKGIETKVQGCKTETEEAHKNGEITDDEYNNRIESMEDYVDETNEIINSLNNRRIDSIDTIDFNKKIECEDIFDTQTPGALGWMLVTILNYIKVIGPILVVLLSAIDFVKAVFSSDDKAIKEAQSKLIIRLIAAIALFLVPTLIQVLLSFINQTTCML